MDRGSYYDRGNMKLSEKKSAKRNSPNSPKLEGGIFYQKKTPQTPFFTKTYVNKAKNI